VLFVTDLHFEYQRTFRNQLVACFDQMGEFSRIKSQQQLVTNVIREEEASFLEL
jgi:hypothetical protein